MGLGLRSTWPTTLPSVTATHAARAAGPVKNRWESNVRQIGRVAIQLSDSRRDLYRRLEVLEEAGTNSHAGIIVDTSRAGVSYRERGS